MSFRQGFGRRKFKVWDIEFLDLKMVKATHEEVVWELENAHLESRSDMKKIAFPLSFLHKDN